MMASKRWCIDVVPSVVEPYLPLEERYANIERFRCWLLERGSHWEALPPVMVRDSRGCQRVAFVLRYGVEVAGVFTTPIQALEAIDDPALSAAFIRLLRDRRRLWSSRPLTTEPN
ncbi:hypothetical protein SAMN06265795_12727 [Noviherbaspirillum humi]|uniref:Uncharacterized protein n=1 Tax=Noviherbaspirillum humi TaxID=1688639 RepID=A0A239LW69_9BURK|nr:hypothetical protein [Noviherbaspirillum humi]SNT34776.1 hypothetical protein SAMN06265795_12727 [Noviherbaspirillum humi]